MQKILLQIKNNLLKIETILSTEIVVSLLEKKHINTSEFLNMVKEYLDKFEEIEGWLNKLKKNGCKIYR